jgi:hypothetical protein
MNKLLSLSLMLILFVASLSSASAQDAVKAQLEEKIKVLTKENELLSKEIDLLKKEMEQLKALKSKEPKNPPEGKADLNDIFVVGAKFTTRSQHTVGPTKGTIGVGTMTITARDGNSFTATNTWVVEKDGTSGSGQIQGKITAPNKLQWRRVDAPNGMFVEAVLRKDGKFIDTYGRNGSGTEIKGVIDVSK